MMEDLVIANSNMSDVDVLLCYELDDSHGWDDNDFELTVPLSTSIPYGHYLYRAETDCGGIVDARRVVSNASGKKVVYKGRTWQGILAGKVLSPDSGQDYLTYSGDLNTIIAYVISRTGLGGVFVASSELAGTSASGRFDRYANAYTALRKVCRSKSHRLRIRKLSPGLVELAAVPLTVHELDSDHCMFDIEENRRPVNHLICLGKGELSNRTVLHLFADEAGNVSTTQTLFGVDEVTEVYDYSSADSADLQQKGIERLSGYQESDSCDIDLANGQGYEIDDKVHVTDVDTGVEITAAVSQVVVEVDECGLETVSYEVGNVTF